jgi:hypothetical protein
MDDLMTWWMLLALAAPVVAVAGMSATVYGRLAIHCDADGKFYGPTWAWTGYASGIVLTAAAAVMLGISAVEAVTAWMT